MWSPLTCQSPGGLKAVLSSILAFSGGVFLLMSDATVIVADEPPAAEFAGQGSDMDHHEHAEGAVDAMTPHLQHTGPHMKWTTLRPANADDARRGEQIVQTLREELAKYKDYHVAVNEGYAPLHPDRKAKHYHFVNKRHRFMARTRFDPASPSALLYKKTGDGYELEGAMYTAPKLLTEEQLNERVPLSVAQWHAHINLCFSKDGTKQRINRRQFGFRGTIATESECQEAGGQFVPQGGGWMIHVYPFKSTPAEIWTH